MFLHLQYVIKIKYRFMTLKIFRRTGGRAVARKKTDAGSVRDGLQPGGTDH